MFVAFIHVELGCIFAGLHNISLYQCSSIYLSILLLIEKLFPAFGYRDDAVMRICIQLFSFWEEDAHLGAFLLCIHLGLKLLIHWVWIYLASLDIANHFFKLLVQIYIPRITFALYHYQHFKYTFLFHFSNSDGYVMVFHSDFNLHSTIDFCTVTRYPENLLN